MYVCMYVRGEGEESPKKFFRPGPKIRGGPGPHACPLDPPLHNHFSINKSSRLVPFTQ